MAKAKVVFECSECGDKHSKWQGKCNGCGAWNSLIEVVEEAEVAAKNTSVNRFTALNTQSQVVNLDQISAQDVSRKVTHIDELDRVLGGGLALGSVILLGGDPGIGKSTLLLQTLAHLAQAGNKVLYVTGEESVQQVALRAKRLEIASNPNLRLMSEIRIEAILPQVEQEKPDVVVIDSIQTAY